MTSSPLPRRAHPLSIFSYLYRFLFLLIIPVLRGFLYALRGGLVAWVSGAWMDLLIVVLIVAMAWLRWRNFQYYMCNDGFYYTNGILYQQQTTIPADSISAFSIFRPFWLKPFRLVKVRLDTIAKDTKKPDLSFYLLDEEAQRLLEIRQPQAEAQSEGIREFRPGLLSIFFLSVFTSNSLFGVLFLSTFISQAGQLLGDEFSYLIMGTLEKAAKQLSDRLPDLTTQLTAGMLAVHISPVAAGIGLVLLAGWSIAFFRNLLQTKNLCTRREKGFLRIDAGVPVKKTYSIKLSDICYMDIRQSLLTRLFRLYSVYVDAIGFAKEKSDVAAIVPFAARRSAMAQLGRLMPEFAPSRRVLKPNAGAIFKFIIEPLWACVLVPVATLIGIWLLPGWAAIISFAGSMGMLPALWFLGVRLLDFFSSGLARSKDLYTLRYSNGYYLHTVVFPYNKIVLVNIRQSILQRGGRKCDLVVSTRSEGRRKHHIRNLGWDDCVRIFDALEE